MSGSHDTGVMEGEEAPTGATPPRDSNPIVGTCSQCGFQLLEHMPEDYVCKNLNCPVHLNLPSKLIC